MATAASEARSRPRLSPCRLVVDFESFEPYQEVQCHPERSEPASEVEGSATRRVERSGSRILRKLRMTFSPCTTRNLRDAGLRAAHIGALHGAARWLGQLVIVLSRRGPLPQEPVPPFGPGQRRLVARRL